MMMLEMWAGGEGKAQWMDGRADALKHRRMDGVGQLGGVDGNLAGKGTWEHLRLGGGRSAERHRATAALPLPIPSQATSTLHHRSRCRRFGGLVWEGLAAPPARLQDCTTARLNGCRVLGCGCVLCAASPRPGRPGCKRRWAAGGGRWARTERQGRVACRWAKGGQRQRVLPHRVRRTRTSRISFYFLFFFSALSVALAPPGLGLCCADSKESTEASTSSEDPPQP